MSQPRILHEFELGRRGTVRASLTRLSGKLYADLRLWVEPSPGAPLVPTKAGLCVAPDWLPVVRECLDALIAATLTDPPPLAPRDRRPDPFRQDGPRQPQDGPQPAAAPSHASPAPAGPRRG